MSDTIQFDEDTGDTGLRISVFNELDGRTTDLLFSKFPLRIGRNARNDLVLRHEYVSQWHAVLGLVDGVFSVMQVGSSNSVRLNDLRMTPNEVLPLESTATIRIVPFRLHLHLVTVPQNLRKPTDTIQGPEPLPLLPGTEDLSGLDEAALCVLNRFSERFLGRSLHHAREVSLLGARLEEAFDIFLSSFVALQTAQRQFQQEMEISLPHGTDHPLAQASSGAELGTALLSTADPGATQALSESLASLGRHQVALLKGLQAGVRYLMKKLGPDRISRQAEKEHRRVSFKALWEIYSRIHGDLSEDQASFRLVYGSPFRKAYTRLMKGKKR